MAVSFVNLGAFQASAGSLSVPAPTGIQSGDVLILVQGAANQALGSPPSGWTPIDSAGRGVGGAANSINMGVFWKRATGTTEANVSLADSGDKNFGQMFAFRGAIKSGTPVAEGFFLSGASSPVTAGAIASMHADSLMFYPVFIGANGFSVNSVATSLGALTSAQSSTSSAAGTSGCRFQADYITPTGVTSQSSPAYTVVTSSNINTVIAGIEILAQPAVSVTGAMGKMGAAADIKNKATAAASGAMGKMGGVIGVTLGALSTTSAITGALGQMKGSANLLDKDGVSVTGALGKMSGVASIINKMQAAIVGALGAMIGSATVTEKNTVAVSGSLGPVKGLASVGANEHVAIVGALGPMGGSVNLLDKDGVSVTGGLGAMSGSADIVLTEQLSVQGALGQMGADVLIHSAIGAAVTGTMGQMSGSAALLLGEAISVTGTMGQMSGEAAVMLREAVSIHGALGPMGAALTGTVTLPPGGTAITGALGQMKGAATLTIDDKLRHTVTGALGKMGGAIIARHMAAAVGGALRAMAGHVVATSGSPVTCYDVADDRRELILTRLAGVLAGVAGIASFKRNDPTVVESKLPAILMLDGDETAGVPRGWDKGRPAPFPMMIAMRPEVYLFTEEGSGAGTTLNTIQDAIIKAVLNDAELQSLCRDTWLVYEGSQVAFALGRALEGEMGLNFTFNYMLDPKAVCAPLDDLPGFAAATLREGILAAMARAVEGAEGVAFFLRNEITRPEEMSPAVFMLDGDEFVDPSLYAAGRPPTVPKPASADPEVYAVVNNAPEEVGQGLNRLRLMVLRTVLNDPLLTRLAADRDIRYEGVQTGLALGRSMAGEMGLKFSVRYVLKP